MKDSLILKTRDLQRMLNVGRTSIHVRFLKDPTFPKPLKLGLRDNTWLRAEVETWLQSRAVRAAA